ncbi:MAG TPA: nuclear transport factor 2 family protein [Thermoanaerobaculia bacterium]|jgi:ketosteroid isomerase-like protein|nr:nuclear transport factor 2 family protein [Thermoanaerobaculia bacterium]
MKRLSTFAVLTVLAVLTLPLFAATKAEDDLNASLTAYRQALVKRDLPALEKTWTDDYTFIDAHGRVLTKADRLADLRSSATSLDKIRNEDTPRIRVHGDIGIISSVVTITGRYSGKEVSGQFRSTHIWILSGGHWHLMMNQLTPIEK